MTPAPHSKLRHRDWCGAICLTVLCLGLLTSFFAAANPVAEEYKLKAALVYKLAKFITWPEREGETNKFGICVLGRDDFGPALSALEGRRLGEKTITIHRFAQSSGIRDDCRIVFVSRSKKAFITDIARTLGTRPILTVGDSRDFAAQGGMIELTLEGGRIGFRINLARAEQAGLKIAAPLLGIARIVREGDQGDAATQ